MQRRGSLCGSDIYDRGWLVFRPWSLPPHSILVFCFGYEPAPPYWQSSQVVGRSGTAQAWDSKGNQHFERQLSSRRDSSGRRTSAISDASNRSRTAGGIAVTKPTPLKTAWRDSLTRLYLVDG